MKIAEIYSHDVFHEILVCYDKSCPQTIYLCITTSQWLLTLLRNNYLSDQAPGLHFVVFLFSYKILRYPSLRLLLFGIVYAVSLTEFLKKM